MAKRREFNVFSLSFLDIMSCGFGAVILVFIVINHSSEVESQEINVEMMAEIKKLEEQITEGQERLVEVRNSIDATEDEVVTTEGMAANVIKDIRELESQIREISESGTSQDEEIEELKQELKRLQEEAATLEGSVAGNEETGTALRSFVGEGDRQYLTGLNVGGRRILILVDGSASMLHETIVNAVRLSNMDDARKRQAEKWQRAVRTVEWIMANLPHDARFQLMTFSTNVESLNDTTLGPMATENGLSPDVQPVTWYEAIDEDAADNAIKNLKSYVPQGGTSLHYPFAMVRTMEPRPDNIYLIVDSLPSWDFEPPRRSAIKSSERVKRFSGAMEELPQDIPVNVILFPMEGDPMATPYFWILAQVTGGAFLTPSKDWP